MQGFTLLSLFSLTILTAIVAAASLATVYRSSKDYSFGLIDAMVFSFAAWSVLAASFATATAISLIAVFLQLLLPFAYLIGRCSLRRNFSQTIAILVCALALWVIGEALLIKYPLLSASFEQRNSLSGWLMPAVFVLFPVLLTSDAAKLVVAKHERTTLIYFPAILLGLFIVFFSTSRAALGAYIIAFLGFMWTSRRFDEKEGLKLVLALSLWAFLLADVALKGGAMESVRTVGIVSEAVMSDQAFSEALATAEDGVAVLEQPAQQKIASANERFLIWRGTINLARETPWHGFGPGSFRLLYPAYALADDHSDRQYAHNDLMQLYIELGIPGVVLLLSLGGVLIWRWWRSVYAAKPVRQKALEINALFWGILAVITHSVFTYNLYVPASLVLLGAMLARFVNLTAAPKTPNRLLLQRMLRPGYFYSLCGTIVVLPLTVLGSAVLMQHYHERGLRNLANGALEQAQHNLALALRWYPNAQTAIADANLYLAAFDASENADQKAQMITASENSLNAAFALNPHSPQIPYTEFLLAKRKFQGNDRERFKEVAEAYNRTLALDRRFFAVRLEFARYLIEQGKPNGAIAVLKQGLAEPFPRHPEVMVYLRQLRDLYEITLDEPGVKAIEREMRRMRILLDLA